MSTDLTLTMKVRSSGDGGEASPTSGYPTGSMVRSRPKLPKMRSTTLSPEHKDVVPETEKPAMEDIERDLNTLSNTDFITKYSRRPRASGTTSPASSSRAMSPTHPGVQPCNIRRIESLRLKLVKVKESQDRAEVAARELQNQIIPARRPGVVQPTPFASDSLRWRTQASLSAESVTSSRGSLPDKDASQVELPGFAEPVNRTCVPPTGSVPMTPSVINDLHYKRAWSEPSYVNSSRQDFGDDDEEEDADVAPIRWKQKNTDSVPLQAGDDQSNNQTQYGSATRKNLAFVYSPEESIGESTPIETQSKNSSSSTLRNFEGEDDPPRTLSHVRPMLPCMDQKALQQRFLDTSLVISDPETLYSAGKSVGPECSGRYTYSELSREQSGAPEELTTADNTKEQSHRKELHLSLGRSQLRGGSLGTRRNAGLLRKEFCSSKSSEGYMGEDEGVRGEGEREEDAYIPIESHQAGHTHELVLKAAPSGGGADGSGDTAQSGHGSGDGGDGELLGLRTEISGATSTSGTKKMANGRYLTHPLGLERSMTPPGHCRSVRSIDTNGLASLHNTSEPAPPFEGATSQVRTESVDSPTGSTDTLSEQSAHQSDTVSIESSAIISEGGNDVDRFERRNGKSLKQKSKSDPSGEKQKSKETQHLTTLVGSHAQSTSELKKSEQEHQVLYTEDVVPKTDQIMITDVLEMKRGIDSKLKTDRSRAFPFKKSPKKPAEDTWKASFGEPLNDDEASTAPSSPQTQSPTNTLLRHNYVRLSRAPISGVASLKGIQRSESSASALLSTNKLRGRRDFIVRPKIRPLFDDHLNSRSPGLDRDRSYFGSTLSLMETPASEKEKRELIVEELVETEQQYVETLQRLVDTYMIPMKTQGILDSHLVDDIFYKINEISTHHAMFLAFLEQALQRWNNSTSTIGDVIQSAFSRQTVIENYMSFIENFPRAEKVLDELINKSTFQKFLEQCERETRSKLPLKAQIVKPAQRIPRYELLLRRLIENTPRDHPDYELLLGAEGAIHEVALRINSVKESKHEESLQETLRTLEFLLVTDLVAPERLYHRHDMVQVLSRKDQCCIWLFSDLAVLTCIKRKSGPVNRKSTLLLKSPSGQDFVENVKHKVWLKVPLDDVEIVKGAATFSQKQLVDREQLDDDMAVVTQISDLARKLKGPHQTLDEAIHELFSQINKQLSEHQLKPPPPDTCRVQLMATTHEGVTSITVVFPSPDKKSSWESAFIEIKQKLATLSDGKPPEFLQALQITKTRAGMQFSCAAPIEGLNASQQHDVWVCNSDGYVGHMCLLSLQPEPIVTLNTPVPGCNSRILCICAVPAFHGCKRKGSQRRHSKAHHPPTPSTSPVTIHVESFDGGGEDGDDSLSDMSSSTSDQGSDEDHDDSTLHIRTGVKHGGRSRSPSLTRSESGREGPGLLQDPYKSTMWLGTEDGCIHIFLCTDNIKTTKNKVKVQQNAGVLCIVHVDHKVFVSLDNGDLVVYHRSQDGTWDMSTPETVTIGSASCPVTKMLPVAGKLWCACLNNIIVLNPASLSQEFQFAVSMESKRTIQCLASSGQGVWVAGQSSSKVLLYHATTYEHLLEVSITQAVAQKLQTADDIIKQHKTACLRITALLACKDLLWIGTSAGVVLTLVMPKVTASTTRTNLTQPPVTGLIHGHTGHVRFLTSVEMPVSSKRQTDTTTGVVAAQMSRRASVSLHMLTMATRMLVISGGDGYEDFRNNSSNEAAGRDDSTNHLLLWQV